MLTTISCGNKTYEPIISDIITIVEKGVCATPAKKAAIPTSMKEARLTSKSGKITWPRHATPPPSMPPTKRDGANSPPEPPLPKVIAVAKIFAKQSKKKRAACISILLSFICV